MRGAKAFPRCYPGATGRLEIGEALILIGRDARRSNPGRPTHQTCPQPA